MLDLGTSIDESAKSKQERERLTKSFPASLASCANFVARMNDPVSVTRTVLWVDTAVIPYRTPSPISQDKTLKGHTPPARRMEIDVRRNQDARNLMS